MKTIKTAIIAATVIGLIGMQSAYTGTMEDTLESAGKNIGSMMGKLMEDGSSVMSNCATKGLDFVGNKCLNALIQFAQKNPEALWVFTPAALVLGIGARNSFKQPGLKNKSAGIALSAFTLGSICLASVAAIKATSNYMQ